MNFRELKVGAKTYMEGFDERLLVVDIGLDYFCSLCGQGFAFLAVRIASNSSNFVNSRFEGMVNDRAALRTSRADYCEDWSHLIELELIFGSRETCRELMKEL
jgi:hypothetical protein